jgi:arginase
MRQAIEYLDPKGGSHFHISFDIDAIDPSIVSSTGTLFRGGLNHRESCHIIRRVAQ